MRFCYFVFIKYRDFQRKRLMKATATTDITGGKFRGEGKYGCILSPIPVCDFEEVISPDAFKAWSQKTSGTRSIQRNLVAKMFADESSMEREWKRCKLIAYIDPKQDYFLYPLSKCKTFNDTVQKIDEAFMCDNLASLPNNKEVHFFKIPDGGITFDDYFIRRKLKPAVVMNMMIPVLQGLERLTTNGLIHHDLKFNNIVVNPKNKECKIIDFGLLIRKSKVLTDDNPYIESKYWVHPPEYLLYSAYKLRDWKPLSDNSIKICMADQLRLFERSFHSKDRNNLYVQLLNGTFYDMPSYEKAFTHYAHVVNRQKTPSKIIKYLQQFPDKVDIYSLGLNLLYASMYMDMTNSSPTERDRFADIVRGMINPDPRRRFSIKKTIRMIKQNFKTTKS